MKQFPGFHLDYVKHTRKGKKEVEENLNPLIWFTVKNTKEYIIKLFKDLVSLKFLIFYTEKKKKFN